MRERKLFERWMGYPLEDPDLKAELESIKDDSAAIEDRFYRDLEFGTAGLRGVIGAGTNRMNIYTVRRATQGLADYLLSQAKEPRVAISYDSRIKSDVFARAAAGVLAANGVKALIYRELMPVPALSFAVRELGCNAGVMVTASHNPAKYNGYKAYGPDGCQMTLEAAEEVLSRIEAADIFDGVRSIPFEEGLGNGMIEYIPEELVERYLSRVLEEEVNPGVCEKAGLRLVYTPLNGAGNRCVRTVLARIGINDLTVVPEQEHPDGNFPTCPYPNPEIKEALQLGIELSRKTGADLLLATDPDCDRVGIAVRHRDDYVLLTGNEVGALLLNYIIQSRRACGTMPERPVAIKSIVSTTLADAIAQKNGVQMINVLTGFKFIGEQILLLERRGEDRRFIFGFEESYGYLSGSYVRDKDGVNGSMLIVEMASYYKLQGKTLVDALEDLFGEYGVYYNAIANYAFEGADGMKKMAAMMDQLRDNPPKEVAGYPVVFLCDYKLRQRREGNQVLPIELPSSNVLEYGLENGADIIVRPSGTEPKIKIYFSIKGESEEAVRQLQAVLAKDMAEKLGV